MHILSFNTVLNVDFRFPGSALACSRLYAYRPYNVGKVTWIFGFLDMHQRVVVCCMPIGPIA